MAKNKRGSEKAENAVEPVKMTDSQQTMFDKYAERLTRAAREHQAAQAAFNDVCVLIGGEGCSVRDGASGIELVRPVETEEES